MNKLCGVLLLAALASAGLPSSARADSLATTDDRGRITAIHKGVWEIDLGGIFVLSHNRTGDAEPTTQVSSLGGLGVQYFVNDNISAGATFLASYDRLSATSASTGFGGMVFGSLHLRLGLGAFLRPTLGAGVLVGEQETEIMPGVSTSASQVAGLMRIALPFAYFPSARIVLQAGPELDVTVGSATPDGGEAATFTTVSGGFGVSAGYAF